MCVQTLDVNNLSFRVVREEEEEIVCSTGTRNSNPFQCALKKVNLNCRGDVENCSFEVESLMISVSCSVCL